MGSPSLKKVTSGVGMPSETHGMVTNRSISTDVAVGGLTIFGRAKQLE